MAELAKAGSFCPNPICPDYEQVQESGNNIIKFGHTCSGRQCYKCRRCGKTFTETRGTIFYRRRTDDEEILECLAMIAEGSRISLPETQGTNAVIRTYRLRLSRMDGETFRRLWWKCTEKYRNIQGAADLPPKNGRSRTGSITGLTDHRWTLKELFTTVVVGEQHSGG